MKKFLALLLALVMILSLAACGSKNTGKENNTPDNSLNDTDNDKSENDQDNAQEPVVDGDDDTAEPDDNTDDTQQPDDNKDADKDDSNDKEEQKPPVLSSTDFTLKNNGDSHKLKVSNVPSGAEITWSSSNEKVAKVAKDGTVTAVSKGSATITATIDAGGDTYELQCIVRCRAENAGSEGGNGGNGNEGGNTSVDLNSVASSINSSCSLHMEAMGKDVVNSKVVGLSGYSLKQVVGMQCLNIIQPMELIFVECASTSDASAVAGLMNSYIAETLESQGWYPPYAIWENAKVITEGCFVGLIVAGDSQSAAESAFRNAVK